ncbi:MAG: rRNA maturation RNase YbeY [Lachnospiraceae bacterium]|nr:rRNA maturation RNase YbeY [Lachnospiraceae bacterium]
MVQINFWDEISEEINEEELALARKVVEYVLLQEGCPFDCEVNLTMTDNEGIQAVNKEFRNMDKPTDVLSFPNCDFEVPGEFSQFEDEDVYFDCFNPDNDLFVLGDIMISRDKMQAQAEEYGHGVTREFAFLIAHSVLHLIGYDHMEEADAKCMEQKQTEYLNNLGITR